jgi:SAM-dependent methyltransferase
MTKKSSYLRISKNPIYQLFFSGYMWLSALTNPVWWILDSRTKTVLDVGCGQGYPMQMLKMLRPVKATGVDLFEEYLKEARKLKLYDKLVVSDVRKLPFPAKSFDSVICLQVIEHQTKKDGLKLLKDLEKIARYQVIIATPIGYFDHPDMDDNELQRHKSGWYDKDFTDLGYKVGHQSLSVFFGNDGLVHQNIPSFIKAIIFVLDKLLTPIFFLFPQTSDYWIIAYKRVN